MTEASTWADERPVILFVLGMSRSGTSALTRVLSLCGATLPRGMMGGDKGNERGYWEPRESLFLNRKILARHGSAWWDSSLLDDDGFDAKEKAACLTEIEAYLTELPATPLVVIKDLQIVPLADMWFEAARQTGFNIATVIAVRHPQEVIGSLQAAVGATAEHTSALWLKGNLLSERNTRGVPRAFIEYANLLKDWRHEIDRISTALSLDLSGDDAAIEEFLTPDLRRNHDTGTVVEKFGTDWMSAVYETMHAAAADQPWDQSVLDRVYEGYRAGEHDFREAFEGSRRYTNSLLTKVFRPAIAKPLSEIVAMAHRRKGAWA